MPVMEVSVNGRVVDLSRPSTPEHDVKKQEFYRFRRDPGWHTPRQLCQTGKPKVFSSEEIKEYAKANGFFYREKEGKE